MCDAVTMGIHGAALGYRQCGLGVFTVIEPTMRTRVPPFAWTASMTSSPIPDGRDLKLVRQRPETVVI